MRRMESGNDADTATATAKGFVHCNGNAKTLRLLLPLTKRLPLLLP
jgi:hypothetical protein